MALIATVIILAIGLLLLMWVRRVRRRHGLTDAPTLDLDGRTLYSPQFQLTGRPDRVIWEGGYQIPEEWNSWS
jgi:hypothetical protein